MFWVWREQESGRQTCENHPADTSCTSQGQGRVSCSHCWFPRASGVEELRLHCVRKRAGGGQVSCFTSVPLLRANLPHRSPTANQARALLMFNIMRPEQSSVILTERREECERSFLFINRRWSVLPCSLLE